MKTLSFWQFIKEETGFNKEDFEGMSNRQQEQFNNLLFRLFTVKFANNQDKLEILEKLLKPQHSPKNSPVQ